jgi:hypothetical protein
MSDRTRQAEFSVRCEGCERLTSAIRTDFHPAKSEYRCLSRWLGFAPYSTKEECPKQASTTGAER